jgi:outer membrane protein assembly factor BamB
MYTLRIQGQLAWLLQMIRCFFTGSTDVDQPSKLNALDAFTGELVWKSKSRSLFPIIADESGVYVEGDGPGSIKKYDPDTGEILWSRNFWTAGGVMHFIVYDGNLHAYLSPDKHKILRRSDGKTLFSLFPQSPPFFESTVCGTPYLTPIYTVDTIYYRENISMHTGEVCAVDISTGKLRWKSNWVVISNVVVSKDAIFVLVEDGYLLALDPTNGDEISELSISIENKPFIPSSAHTTSGNFFLAYDAHNKIIVTYLGDSRQLFAFQMP